jgi:hypothetical protein
MSFTNSWVGLAERLSRRGGQDRPSHIPLKVRPKGGTHTDALSTGTATLSGISVGT